jgi:hypothetical protein
MPEVGTLEQYGFIIQQSNIGFGLLFIVVAVLIGAIAYLAPHFKRTHAFYLALAFGTIARIGIMNRPTWYDEVFTLAVVKAPNFWGAIMGDVHPPLHYAIVKSFASLLGDSIFVLRLPSLIASLVLIYAIYRLAYAYTREISVAQTAAGLVAVLGAPMSYAAEARHPALLALCVIGALIGLAERRQWLFALCVIAAAYLHSIGMVYMAVFVMAAWWMGWNKTATGVMVASAFWIPAMVTQSSQVADGFWLHAQNPLKHIVEMTVFTMDGVGPGEVIQVYMIVIGWSLVGVYMSKDWIAKRGGHWIAIAVGVPLLLAIISILWKPIYLSRALLAPALLLTITWAYAWPRVAWVWRGLLVVAVMMSWFGVLSEPEETFDTRDMRELFYECAGSDFVYVTSTNMAIQAIAYSPEPVKVWRHGNNLDQQLSDETKEAMGIPVIGGYQDLPEGEICVLAQVSHRTNATEQAEINHIRDAHKLKQDETLYQDGFYAYQLMRFDNNVNQSNR